MESETHVKHSMFKQHFKKITNREDGLLLKVHHTTPGPIGNIRRSKFLFASFSCCSELLALSDHRGNIFVIDLANSVFWLLDRHLSISVLCFHSHRRDQLFVGSDGHSLVLLNAETNQQLGSLKGHTEAPTKISFSSDGNFCLSAANGEGFIWDLNTLSQAHRLNLQPGMSIKLAIFMPVSNNILACFQDDAIHIWAFQSFQCIKQIVPDSWKGQNIQSITFTRNGRTMVVGGATRQLVIFNVNDWDSQRVIWLPDSIAQVLHIEFLPQSFDSGANQVLMVLSDAGSVFFVDLSKDSCIGIKSEKDIKGFTCSWSGKYVVCNALSGEAKIFSGYRLLASVFSTVEEESCVPKEKVSSVQPSSLPVCQPKKSGSKRRLDIKKQPPNISPQVETILDLNRLRPILKEFLEYPEQYRALIWRSILQLPGNKEPWKSLSQRPLHPAAQALTESNQIQNKIMFSCLQSVISCLAHWSPVFGELPYLPHFIFPFIKIFHSDKFVCFEVAVTLIVNWCQYWFEYLSFPPVNILGIIENMLSEHDTGLVSLFYDAGITTRLYAWSLLSTAFSEVLTSSQWKQLWDHIISNPPWFLLFAVVAYNICCRASLKSCSSKKDFEFFFRNQNPIDMKHFIKKCYDLMDKTSAENHPCQHIKTFTPLPKENYPVFSEFPKYIVNYQKEQLDAIRLEEEAILREQHMILSQTLAREETRMRERKARIQESRLLEAEKAANTALRVEEERLIEKRQQLAALRRELRAQEEHSMATSRVEAMEHQVKQRSAELDRLHHVIDEKTKQAGLDKDNLNEEVHEQFQRLNVKRQELKDRLSDHNLRKLARPFVENILPSEEVLHLREQQKLLSEEIQKLRKESYNRGTKASDVDIKMAELDSIQHRVEIGLARRAYLQQDFLINAEQCLEEANAATKLQKLEDEVQQLTQKLSHMSNSEDPHAKCKSEMSERKILNLNEPVLCYDPLQSNAVFSLRSSHLYNKEKCAVSSAMDVRKSLLTSWNTNPK